jgi:hypothetical protein
MFIKKTDWLKTRGKLENLEKKVKKLEARTEELDDILRFAKDEPTARFVAIYSDGRFYSYKRELRLYINKSRYVVEVEPLYRYDLDDLYVDKSIKVTVNESSNVAYVVVKDVRGRYHRYTVDLILETYVHEILREGVDECKGVESESCKKEETKDYLVTPSCNDCEWINVTEKQQSDIMDSELIIPHHVCTRYGQRVYHDKESGETCNIMPCDACIVDKFKCFSEGKDC